MPDIIMRKADFLMVLAYASDLATGHPRDFALLSCVLGMRLADLAGFDGQGRRNVFHQALLRYVGCNADTHVLAAAFGDEIALRADLNGLDMGDSSKIGQVFFNAFKRLYADLDPAAQQAEIENGLETALQISLPVLTAHCEVAKRIGERLGLSEEIRRNLGQIYERWDGRGLPRGLAGGDVLPAVQIVTLAQDAIALAEASGIGEMARIVAERADGAYEGRLAMLMSQNAAALMKGIDGRVTRETVLALEPEPVEVLHVDACEAAYLAIADMIDMRMPFTRGHSRAVADLAEAAASHMGLPETDVRNVRWAGLVHDLGELSVPVSIWMRETPMSPRETDAAKLHPYYSERALCALGEGGAGAASLVARHHECLDRSARHGPRGTARAPGTG